MLTCVPFLSFFLCLPVCLVSSSSSSSSASSLFRGVACHQPKKHWSLVTFCMNALFYNRMHSFILVHSSDLSFLSFFLFRSLQSSNLWFCSHRQVGSHGCCWANRRPPLSKPKDNALCHLLCLHAEAPGGGCGVVVDEEICSKIWYHLMMMMAAQLHQKTSWALAPLRAETDVNGQARHMGRHSLLFHIHRWPWKRINVKKKKIVNAP